MNEIYTRGGSARQLNGCHVPCWKKGPVDVDDWSYDNDRWCFLEPCRVLLRCQWHWGLALNASDPVTRLQWKPGRGGCGRDNPVTHIPSKLLQHWPAKSDNGFCRDCASTMSVLFSGSIWSISINGWSVSKATTASVPLLFKTCIFPKKWSLSPKNQPDREIYR